MSVDTKVYLVEFFPADEVSPQYEHVMAEDMFEAVYSIKVGWPDCRVENVYLDLNYSEDENNNVE